MLIWVRVIHSWKTHTDAYTQCSGTHWITAFTVTRSETKRNLGRTLHRCVRPCSLDISWGNIFGRKWTTYAKQQCSYPGGSSWPQHLTKALFWGTFLWICTMLNGSRLSVKGVSSIIKKALEQVSFHSTTKTSQNVRMTLLSLLALVENSFLPSSAWNDIPSTL